MDFEVTPLTNPDLAAPTKLAKLESFLLANKGKIISGLLALLVLLGSWYYFFGLTNFSETGVDFKIDGPSEVSSGDLVTYKLTYKNNNKIALANARLVFFYPSDAVVIKDGNIASFTNESIDLQTLAAGQEGSTELTAYLVGDKGNIKTAKAVLTYTPANVRSVFKKEITLASTITTLAIPVSLVAPPTAINGQSISYIVDYRNQSQRDFTDLRFKLKYPEGFSYTSASPTPTTTQNTWDVSSLKQDNGARITIQGRLQGKEREAKTVTLVLQKKIITPQGDTYVDFEKSEATTAIASALLSVQTTVNDSTDYTAHLGDTLNYSIRFRNNSNTDIGNLTLTVNLNGSMFDASTLQSGAFFDSRTNTVTWGPALIPELNLLRPGQSGTATFAVRLKSAFVGGSIGTANTLVRVNTHLETPNVPADLSVDQLAADDQLIIRISSDPTFDQKLYRNDQQFGAQGPYPPKVDKQTNFTVRWALVNPSNDITGTKITATLPPGVKWQNQVRTSAGGPTPSYDSRLSTVTWNIGTLPSGVGLSGEYAAYFVISITPSTNQVNQTLPLVKGIRFDGTDSFTGEKISRTVQDSGTNNVVDSNAGGSVQP